VPCVSLGSEVMDKCSIGEGLNESCDKVTINKRRGRVYFSSLSEHDQFCLVRRTGLENITDICIHHKEKYQQVLLRHTTGPSWKMSVS